MKHYLHIGVMLAFALIATLMLATGDASGILLLPVGALTLDELANTINEKLSEFKGLRADLDGARSELTAKTAANDDGLKKFQGTVDEMLTKFNGLAGTVTELEQKMASRAKETPDEEKSWGEQFINSASYKNATDRGARRGVISAEIKAVTSTTAGGLIRSARETDVVNLLRERRVVRDLLRTVPVNTSSVDYATQTVRTNNAAPVAEGAAKPYSEFEWSSATVVVRTLAHLAKITRQAMDDAPRLMAEINAEMRYGLGYLEERQFLYGTGVGQNLHGIIPQATAFAGPVGFTDTKATRVDVLRLAMLQTSLALLPADGIVLSEADWALIEMTKTDDGAYLFANPQGNVSARMWGLPVVATPAMTAGDYLVGNFQMGATVYDRMGVEVLVSTENVDDFEKNLATVRAEERVAIAVKRPSAFVEGTFATDINAINGP